MNVHFFYLKRRNKYLVSVPSAILHVIKLPFWFFQIRETCHIFISSTLFLCVYFLFIYLWLCWVFDVTLGLSLVAVHRLLIAVASLVVEHRL